VTVCNFRNVGFGFLSIFNRAAAMAGPQLSYLASID